MDTSITRRKPRVNINNWYIASNRLYGVAFDHPHMGKDSAIKSSPILEHDALARTCETANTIYLLGDSL